MAESENTMQLYAPQDTIAFSVRHPPLNRTKRNPSPRPLHRFLSSELSVAIDGFPNTLMIGGPNSEVGKSHPTIGFENVANYAVKCVQKAQFEHIESMAPPPRPAADFSASSKLISQA